MTFTESQLDVLAQFEGNFHTAIHADWSRAIGKTGTELMQRIWQEATGDAEPVNSNCAHCVLSLIKRVGAAYYKDRDEQAKKGTTKATKTKKTAKK